jgi:hypothetical protein
VTPVDDDVDVPEDLRDRRYRGLRVLGHGAQATTFEATDVKDGRLVAIKRFVVRGAKSWKEVELAEREASVLAGLSHPLIPGYVEHFEERGALYLVTTKIEGESLAAIRARGGTLDEAEVARMLRDLGDALGYLHGRSPPIVHRDVKPGNIIRTPSGRYVLVDFGAVQARLRPGGGSTVVGTFGFMAPEQFQGRARPTSDVYGAGATALAMLTGVEPEDLPHRGLGIDVRAALGRRVPSELVQAIEQMVQPDPDRRADRVPRILGDEPPRADTKKKGERDESSEREKKGERGRGRGASFHERLEQSREQILGDLDDKWRKRERREKRKQAEHEERAQRRAVKRARKREQHRQRALVVGGITRMAVLVGLLVATIAVQLACRAIVPAVLVALSVLFGENLRRAARVVSAAGERATLAIGRARERVTGLRLPDEERFEDEDDEATTDAKPRVRIDAIGDDAGADVEAELELDAEDEAEEARRASRRRP